MAVVDRVAELPHEAHLILGERPLVNLGQVLPELAQAIGGSQADVNVGVREYEAVAHSGRGDRSVLGPAAGPDQQPPPARGGVADQAGVVG